MSTAPIAVFVYRRAEHARRVLDALAANAQAAQSDLFVFSDAARTPEVEADVQAVRAMLREVHGFRSLEVIERERNLGLARSIIGGVTELTQRFGRVIVLEDDLLPGPHFLEYMNAGLARYADEPRVASIHGYCYPVHEPLPPTFFLKGADCWGWATWQRAWALFDADGERLLAQIRQRGLQREFDFDGSYPYTQMLEDAVAGRNDSWAVRWYASAFLRDMLTLYPGSSQVQNIGADGSGSHVGATAVFSHSAWGERLEVAGIPVEQSQQAHDAFARFLAGTRAPLASRIIGRLQRLLGAAQAGR